MDTSKSVACGTRRIKHKRITVEVRGGLVAPLLERDGIWLLLLLLLLLG